MSMRFFTPVSLTTGELNQFAYPPEHRPFLRGYATP